MAKARKYHGDRHERFLGAVGNHVTDVTAGDLPDLGEEDVWASGVGDDDGRWRSPGRESGSDRPGRASRRWLGREEHRYVGGLSLAFEQEYRPGPAVLEQLRRHHGGGFRRGSPAVAATAPVRVPGWGRLVRVDSAESVVDLDRGESEGEWVPPHEYLAREQGKVGGASSVFEGVGRTLKGRDMSRVRDAVWSQTGFFG